MINLNLVNISPLPAYAIFGSLLINTFVLFNLVTQYYTRILDFFISSLNSDNDFVNAIFVFLVNNIPRIISVSTLNSVYSSTSVINGIGIYNITFGLAILIFSSSEKCHIKMNCFIKDFIFLTVSLIAQNFSIQKVSFEFFKFLPVAFLIFLAATLKMRFPQSFRVPPEVKYFELMAKITNYSTKYFFNLLIMDLNAIYKLSLVNSLKIFISPIINLTVYIVQFKNIVGTNNIIGAYLLAAIIGIFLIKTSKNPNTIRLNYLYGLLASIFYIYLFINALPSILNNLSLNFNIQMGYLKLLLAPVLIVLPEILNLLYYVSNNNTNVALFSLIYSTIFNSLMMIPLNHFIQKDYRGCLPAYEGDSFALSFHLIALSVILLNYITRNQKLSRDLAYFLVLIYILYNLQFLMNYYLYVKIAY